MKMTYKKVNNIAILKIEGDVIIGVAPRLDVLGALRSKMSDFINGGVKAVLLNVSELGTADSAFLGEVAGSLSMCQKQGVGFGLVAPAGPFARLIDTTRFVTLLPVFKDDEEGLASYALLPDKQGSFGPSGDTDPDGFHHLDG